MLHFVEFSLIYPIIISVTMSQDCTWPGEKNETKGKLEIISSGWKF